MEHYECHYFLKNTPQVVILFYALVKAGLVDMFLRWSKNGLFMSSQVFLCFLVSDCLQPR